MTRSAEQLKNARDIVAAARSRGLSPADTQKAAVIGIMTAIPESQLRRLSNGNTGQGSNLNPEGIGYDHDSVGVFQQRDSWGTAAQRMDTYTSANLFFDRMLTIKGWQSMAPGVVAQTVQVSAYPDRYAANYEEAQQIYAQVATPPDPALVRLSGVVDQLWTSLGVHVDDKGNVVIPNNAQDSRYTLLQSMLTLINIVNKTNVTWDQFGKQTGDQQLKAYARALGVAGLHTNIPVLAPPPPSTLEQIGGGISAGVKGVAGAVTGVVDWAESAGKILSWLGTAHNWVRIGYVAVGVAILAIVAIEELT